MAIITLTSDWGYSDYYLPAVKAAIYSALPDANIVDISHNIELFDIRSAAFIVKNCYKSFPKGTVHILAVDTEESPDSPHILLKCNGHYFIGADNSIFSLIVDKDPYEAIIIDAPQDTPYYTFSTRDRFVKVAVMIVSGVDISNIGKIPYQIKEKLELRPTYTSTYIKGLVNYIDAYENLVTNIPKSLFEQVRAGRKFVIKAGMYKIDKIREGYQDKGVQEADIVAVFGTHGFLEIAICKGRAASLLGMDVDSTVNISFEDSKDNDKSNNNTLF